MTEQKIIQNYADAVWDERAIFIFRDGTRNERFRAVGAGRKQTDWMMCSSLGSVS